MSYDEAIKEFKRCFDKYCFKDTTVPSADNSKITLKVSKIHLIGVEESGKRIRLKAEYHYNPPPDNFKEFDLEFTFEETVVKEKSDTVAAFLKLLK